MNSWRLVQPHKGVKVKRWVFGGKEGRSEFYLRFGFVLGLGGGRVKGDEWVGMEMVGVVCLRMVRV